MGLRRKILVMSSLLILTVGSLIAADLTLIPEQAGGWYIQLDENMLSQGAGSDFLSSIVSSTSCERLAVDTDTQDDPWSILVMLQSDATPFIVEVLITDEGVGDHTASYSDDFQVVSTESMTMISGTGDRSDITVQYRLTGISIETISSTQSSMGLLYVLSL